MNLRPYILLGLPNLETQNYGQKMSISYNCVKQPSYAAPFGECRADFQPMKTIQKGGGSDSDLKVGRCSLEFRV